MILADHCVFETTVRVLKTAGHVVTRLAELTNRDAPDDEVLRLAVHHDLILLTNDKDFGNITLYPPAQHVGVILLKIAADTEVQVHGVLLRMLADRGREGLRRRLAVVDHRKYRIRN